MKRIRNWRTFENLEQRRLKAADLAACPAAHDPAFVEAAVAVPASKSIEYQVQALHVQQTPMRLESASSDESDEDLGDEQESESDNETDDSDEGETDESDGDDESDSDDSDEGNDDSSDEGDTEEGDSDEDEDEESDDTESDSDDSDDESEEGDSDEDDDEESSDDDSSENDSDGSDGDDSDEGDSDSSDTDDTEENDSNEDDASGESDDDSDESENQEISAPIRMTADTEGTDHVAVPTQSLAASAALSPDSIAIAGSVLGVAEGSESRSSASIMPAANSSETSPVDPNLLDAAYSTSEEHDDDQAALVENDGAELAETTDSAFGSVVTDWTTWAL